ncbi:DUF421 domain-containing protein [Ottowia thiooxydans]|uniref:DUF421 domain-containing protein n=1 Tax=Ottowia thiooxydans TaxID=219182 RepID=UPI0003F53150|nr:YetF domain-containing protein [Ottowia thiooxydans]
MLQLSVPWWEFIIRGIVVYVFLLFFLRLTGRRQIGQYDPFDLILLLILSNAVQNSMNAGDNSLIGGLISALTLISCHVLLARLGWRYPRLARWIDGKPKVLIHAGQLNKETMRNERLTPDDVQAALRAAGCLHSYEVQQATIETSGQITVVLRQRGVPTSDSPDSAPGAVNDGPSGAP